MSTSTTSALPTAGYGVAGSSTISSPTQECIAAASSKRSFLSNLVGYHGTLDDRSMV